MEYNTHRTIDFSFSEDDTDAIAEGRKVSITRPQCAGTMGDQFWIGKDLFQIVAVYPELLGTVYARWYRLEGFEDEESFRRTWGTSHPGWSDDERVYIHLFSHLWGVHDADQ